MPGKETLERQFIQVGRIEGQVARLRKGKRDRKRTKAVLPIRVWTTNPSGGTQSHLAHTLDITAHGVRLGGFRGAVTAGEAIEIQHHHKRARFRVVWLTGVPNSQEKQIGAECLEANTTIWQVEFPNEDDLYDSKNV